MKFTKLSTGKILYQDDNNNILETINSTALVKSYNANGNINIIDDNTNLLISANEITSITNSMGSTKSVVGYTTNALIAELNKSLFNGVNVVNKITINDLFLNERDMAYTEASNLATAGTVGSAVVIDTNVGNLYAKLPVGFLSKVGKIRITTDNPCRLIGYINTNDVTNYNNGGSIQFDFIILAGVHDIDVSHVVFGSRGGFYFDVYSKSTTYPKVQIVFPLGSCVTETKYLDADFVVASLGNSIARGNLGQISTRYNSGETHYINRLSSSLRNLGISTRASKRGINGGLIGDILTYINSGALVGAKPFDVCVLDTSTNNATVAVNAAFSTDLEYIIDWLFDWNPNMSIITVGAVPSDVGGRATNLAGYRTAIQAVNNLAKYATKRTNNQLKYYDASSFVPLVNANFVEAAANNNLHPNGHNGHRLYHDGLLAVVQTTKFYLNNI